uniref:Uncharacterized protein n=1 Tax=Arundo donax TaxID=35708 RepID=A0A0A9GX83_ARUDO
MGSNKTHRGWQFSARRCTNVSRPYCWFRWTVFR